MTTIHVLTPEQHATVLAALRNYQNTPSYNIPSRIKDIATSGDTLKPLTDADIDGLCAGLNNSGLDFGDVVNLLGTEDGPYLAAAHEHRLLDEGTLEVDGRTIVTESDEGAYVMAWLWVSNKEAGVEPEPTGMGEG